MKVPLGWLKEYVPVNIDAGDLAHRLTMAGAEVTAVDRIGGSWDDVVVGCVTEVKPHPNADRLQLAVVDAGSEIAEVVCGAPNIAAGQKVAFARVGACLIDGHTGEYAVLKPAKIRGISSSGMVCSEKELGISDEHQGILVLPEDAPLGVPLEEYMGETILDLEITPNRPDLLSIIGIGRECAALLGTSAHICEPGFKGTGRPIQKEVKVTIEAPDLCPRYSASLIRGVTIGPSPDWLKTRLINAGMRPINNVVDVTNYVMLEYGQPLHAFDFERLVEGSIIVRRAGEGQTFTSLDGLERRLTGEMLMICDGRGEIAIAGVMGGENSEVTDGTSSILLEAASFNPASIHFTSNRLGLSSAASQRFERGLSPYLTQPALLRATDLILQTAGGEAAEGIIDLAPGLPPIEKIEVSTDRINALLGTEYKAEEISRILESLGCILQDGHCGAELSVMPPEWRSDIRLEADIAEEIARIRGYDDIPMTMLSKAIPQQTPDPMLRFKKDLKNAMVGLGFQEILTWSMTSTNVLSKALNQQQLAVKPLHLKKPMTVEQECLRTSLRPGLIAALASNRRFEDGPIRLFELGTVYLPAGDGLPEEPQMLAGIIYPSQVKLHWDQPPLKTDFFTVKGVVEGLMEYLGIDCTFQPSNDDGLKPASQVSILVGDQPAGILGQVEPGVAAWFELDEPVFLFELNASSLLPCLSNDRPYRPIVRYPAVVRDIALVVDSAVSHRQIMDILDTFPLIVDVNLFDVYTGKPVPAGKKSMAYRLLFQSSKKTLTDDAVDKVMDQIITRLETNLGAALRSQ